MLTEIAPVRRNRCRASAWNKPAHPAGWHDVDVLEPFGSFAGDRLADFGIAGSDDARQSLVHHVLHDKIVGGSTMRPSAAAGLRHARGLFSRADRVVGQQAALERLAIRLHRIRRPKALIYRIFRAAR